MCIRDRMKVVHNYPHSQNKEAVWRKRRRRTSEKKTEQFLPCGNQRVCTHAHIMDVIYINAFETTYCFEFFVEYRILPYGPVSYTHLDVYKRQRTRCKLYMSSTFSYLGALVSNNNNISMTIRERIHA